MKLHTIRFSNFQSFGEVPTELSLEDITYLIGPNGAGKTAILQALCRLFAINPSLRRIQQSDFHVPFDEESAPEERQLRWPSSAGAILTIPITCRRFLSESNYLIR